MKIVIGFIAGFIAASVIFNLGSPEQTETLVKGTKGIQDSSLNIGIEKLKVDTTSFYESFTGKGQRTIRRGGTKDKDSTLFSKKILSGSSSVDLKITTYPAVDSIKIESFWNIAERTFERIDTLFITRVDTLQMTKIINEENAFYDNFAVGFSVASFIILIISLLKI